MKNYWLKVAFYAILKGDDTQVGEACKNLDQLECSWIIQNHVFQKATLVRHNFKSEPNPEYVSDYIHRVLETGKQQSLYLEEIHLPGVSI